MIINFFFYNILLPTFVSHEKMIQLAFTFTIDHRYIENLAVQNYKINNI